MASALDLEELQYRLKLLENEARWRDQAQQALKENEERLKVLFEYAPDIYFLVDLKGRLIDANRAAEKLSGYDRSQVIGKNLFGLGLIPSDQIPRALENLSRIVERQPTRPEEFTLIRKDGTRIPVEMRSYPVRISGTDVVLTLARDISGQKEILLQLDESIAIYRFVFRSHPEPILLISPSAGRIVDANPPALRLLGFPEELPEGIPLETIGLSGSLDHLRPDGSPDTQFDLPCELRRKDGSRFRTRLRIQPVTASSEAPVLVFLHPETPATDTPD